MKETKSKDISLYGNIGLFEGGGEMGDLMQAYDWDEHSLGPPGQWPQSLQTGIRMMLLSGFPMFIWWAEEFFMFHNDAYLPALGKKHPEALGASARKMWAEIWGDLGVIAEKILKEGNQFYAEDLIVLLDRKGFIEETYWTFSYSPMPKDDGSTGGVFCACTEVTGKVLGKRRLNTIKEIADASTQLLTIEQTCQQASKIIDKCHNDSPYNLIYLLNEKGTQVRLVAKSAGVPDVATPVVLDFAKSGAEKSWNLAKVQRTRQSEVINDVTTLFGELSEEAWPEFSTQAVIIPIQKPGVDQLFGFMVLGLSARLAYDYDYQGFHRLLSGQIASTIASVQARSEIEAREKNFREIADSIPHLVWTARADGYVDYANQRWYEYTGFQEEETLGWEWANAIHPEDLAGTRQAWASSVASGVNVLVEYRLRSSEGVYRWHRIKAVPFLDNNQEISKWYGTITDIQEEKLLEIGLRESQQAEQRARAEAEAQRIRLYNILMQAPAIICLMQGPEHTFELVNPLAEQLLGRRTLLGKTALQAIPELKNQPFIDILNKVYQSGEPFIGKEMAAYFDRNMTGQLEEVYLNLVYQPVYDQAGNIDGILAFATEVTEQVRARRLVEQSEENLKMALEAGNMATFDLDLLTKQTIRSASHDQLFGYESNLPEWNMEALLKHMLPEDRPLVLEQFEKSLESGKLFLNPRIQRIDGTIRWIEGQGEVFYDDSGKPVRVAGVITDVTERKLSEQRLQAITEELAAANEEIQANNEDLAISNSQLIRINADLDNFVYTASHDLRSPINSMEGLLVLLQKRLQSKLDEKDQELIRHLTRSMAKLNQTIKDLSEIVKAQKDTGLAPESISFAEVLEDIQTDMSRQIEDQDINIEWQLEVTTIEYPKKHLRSIVYNLLSNAMKYRHPDRKAQIVVRTEKKDEKVLLSVSDNGLGINEYQLNKLFGMFQRMHPHIEGSGIGLYTIKRVVENYGGKITVESKEGEGTTFYVHF
jgi:PAS domain S-box-containing protein